MGLAPDGIVREETDTERHGEAFTIDGGGRWMLLAEVVTTDQFHLQGRAKVDARPG